MYTIVTLDKPKIQIGVKHVKRMQLQYGNEILRDVQFEPYVLPQWEKCYALHRKHNHSLFIIVYWA